MLPTIPAFTSQEQDRLVAVAQDLFMERGIGPVGLPEVALASRLPEATVTTHFPTGKPALVAAATARYLAGFRAQLAEHGPASSTAVEELLRVRRVLQALPDEMRSLFVRELATDYPDEYQHLQAGRQVSVFAFMRQNLRRGIGEGLYRPGLDVEQETRQWFEQADVSMQAASTTQELAARLTAQVTDFLGRVATSAGALVTRRLQEAAPYY